VTPEVMAFVRSALPGDLVRGRDVLEVGSRDVNGSPRHYLKSLSPASYIGVDAVDGDGVDLVLQAEGLEAHFGADRFGVVVSTEMLEHAEDWRTALLGMMAVAAPGGVLVLTTRSPGFDRHEWPGDYWRFTTADLAAALDGWIGVVSVPDPYYPGAFASARKPEPWDRARAAGRLESVLPSPAPEEETP